MIKTKYAKEDLLWEATRRNEEFKEYYYKLIRRQNGKIDRWKRLWDIPNNYRWKIPGAIDPSISVDEIKEKIDSGADRSDVHPYFKYFRDEKKSVIHHITPGLGAIRNTGSSFIQHSDKVKIDTPLYKWMHNFIVTTKDRIVISISPLANYDIIEKEIKKIRKRALKNIKKDIEDQKKNKAYYPRDVGKYIGWLRKYDEIVDYLKEKKGADNLTIEDGVVMLPDNFSFVHIVRRKKTLPEKFEGQRKLYKETYEKAISLIQTTPNINFSPSRTPKGRSK